MPDLETLDALTLLLKEIPTPRLTTIVDVGANPVHVPPYASLRDKGACRVIGFEPGAAAFAALKKTERPNETYLPYAIGDGQTHDLLLYRLPEMTSLFAPYLPSYTAIGWESASAVTGKASMPTKALDDMADLPPFDLLKIDIQGAELLALQGAQRSLAQAVAVVVELRYMRLYLDEPMLGEIDRELRRQGFGLHKFLFNKSRMLRHSQETRVRRRKMLDQLIDGDAVYLRALAEPQALSQDQIRHMALLGCAVFHSHSLVLYCLDLLVARGAAAPDLPARYVDALPSALRRPDEEE